MHVAMALVCAAVVAADPIDTQFAQVAPAGREAAPFRRSAGQSRAIVLLQGLCLHPFSSRNVAKADFQDWQESDSALVKALADAGDVYAFAYSQNAAVEEIAAAPGLAEGVASLRRLGYREIVLMGHSAGGLLARQFVEDHPDAGVTKVVQVCTPNGGSSWGKARAAVRKSQEVFLDSLTKQGRQRCLGQRADKRIPADVEFVCLVGDHQVEVDATATFRVGKRRRPIEVAVSGEARGDGLVATDCQWTPDLQEQGVPVVPLEIDHFSVIRSKKGIGQIVQLVRERQPRWTAAQVADARQKLFGDGDASR